MSDETIRAALEAARALLRAMDDMHARGETFTARVSVAGYWLRTHLDEVAAVERAAEVGNE